jgi:hypothetical protein
MSTELSGGLEIHGSFDVVSIMSIVSRLACGLVGNGKGSSSWILTPAVGQFPSSNTKSQM